MTQSNSISAALKTSFNIDHPVTGIMTAALTGLAVILLNIRQVPAAFGLIISNAFTGTAAAGGFAGATVASAMRYGVARGVFEVFADTIVIATITALSIILTGVWDGGLTGANLTIEAFNSTIPGGQYIVTISLALFAFSTIIGWEYYGERCFEYLFGPKPINLYRFVWVILVVVGAVGGLEIIWDFSDTMNGLMIIPNLIAVLALSGTVFKLTKDFFSREEKLGNLD